ncbi:Dync1h1, partial [Symbiodinium microadriaticum]
MATGGGTSSLSAEMKAEIQEAVREAMAEVATAKAKAKRKPKGTPGEKDTTRAMGVDERDPRVKSMIAIVAKEKAMLAPKAKASQAFGPPSRTRAKRAEAGPDLETLEDDEGFQHVDPLQEDGDEVQEVPPKPKTSPAKAAPAKPSVPPRLTVDKKSWSDGYDLTKEEHIEKMVNEAKADPPWRIWASLTSSYQVGLRFDNSLQEREHRKKKRYRAKKQVQGLIALLKALMDNEVTPHFYIEWPKEATECWGLEEIEQIKKN